MKINLIVAVAQNGAIGINGKLPWDISEDLAYFKRLTIGHPIIMGRKTFESIGRALPDRLNIVISEQENYHDTTTEIISVYSSISQAIDACKSITTDDKAHEIFIIGGTETYRQALAMGIIDRVYLTEIHHDFKGDAFFNIEWIKENFSLKQSVLCHSQKSGLDYSFNVYDR